MFKINCCSVHVRVREMRGDKPTEAVRKDPDVPVQC